MADLPIAATVSSWDPHVPEPAGRNPDLRATGASSKGRRLPWCTTDWVEQRPNGGEVSPNFMPHSTLAFLGTRNAASPSPVGVFRNADGLRTSLPPDGRTAVDLPALDRGRSGRRLGHRRVTIAALRSPAPDRAHHYHGGRDTAAPRLITACAQATSPPGGGPGCRPGFPLFPLS